MTQATPLDRAARRIVHELQRDARLSAQQLAERVGLVLREVKYETALPVE